MNITASQKKVLDLIKQGYELGFYSGIHPSITLQYGGLGHGGKTEKVNSSTFWSMRKKGLIVPSEKRTAFLTVYKINEP